MNNSINTNDKNKMVDELKKQVEAEKELKVSENAVIAAYRDLDETDQYMLYLRYGEKCTDEEISNKVDKSEDWVVKEVQGATMHLYNIIPRYAKLI